ncbi:MAG: winged helix-turn-helix domain-containing protein [Actinomycetota bacterium]|nr:winged helix-turn-helix domain-containing protein [Actinomycetota bacterium]
MTTQRDSLPSNDWFQELVLRAVRELGGRAHRQEIVQRARDLGHFTEDQLAAPPPPGNSGHFDDKIGFELSFALSHLKAAGQLANPERGYWSLPEAG